MTRAYLGMGSNLGDRLGNLAAALAALQATPGITVAAVSRVYESQPWGVEDQPAFANLVVALDTTVGAHALLTACKRIEAGLGRTEGVRYGPRAIDLDVLLFGDDAIDTIELTVPHPRLLERDFVVTPLLEVAPGARLPGGAPVTRDGAVHGRVTGILLERLVPPAGSGAGGDGPTS
jgi:2-amino-4-hydroxy-6-hydroxymethyldihydropteridine diphosphokinase